MSNPLLLAKLMDPGEPPTTVTCAAAMISILSLTLDHKHDANKLVVLVTRNGATSGDIEATVVGTGDTKTIQVSSLPDDEAADTSFFISVLRVRS